VNPIDLSKLPALPPTHPLPHCPGWGDGPDDWLEECHDCQRRTAAGPETLPPPLIITLWCENYVPPDPPENQRLRELAKELP
jgi:hypothetical protein